MPIPTLLLILIVLDAPVQQASAQDLDPERARIESAEISGLPIDQLSPGLRREIDERAGALQDDARIDRLARRIEKELPDVVAATRVVPHRDGRVRIVYLIARVDEDVDLASNINTRYVVESVAIDGIPDGEITRSLRDRLQDLVGGRLDHDAAERLRDELEAEQPDYTVRQRVSRGSERGRIRVVFEFEEKDRLRWIPFTPSRSKFVYHADHGPSGVLDIPRGTSRHRALLGFAFNRLAVVPIRVPTLRERAQDIPDLAAYFLADFCARNNFRPKTIDVDVLPILERHEWPGNIRELRNAVERMAILSAGDDITVDAVPLEIRAPAAARPSAPHEIRDTAERDRIRQALDQTDWNVAGAARLLGIERTNLHKRIRNLGINRGSS